MAYICIDAGHGGSDSGAVGVNGRLEKNDTLSLANSVATELQRRGHEVLRSRTSDTYVAISARYTLANNAGVDGFISIHRNSAGATANGSEVLYSTTGVKTSANVAKSKTLAEKIQKRIVDTVPFRNRGAKEQNVNTAVLRNTKCPAATVEAGFIVNVNDNTLFDTYYQKLVNAICDGIEDVYGKGKLGDVSVSAQAPGAPTTEEGTWTSVAVPAWYTNGGVAKLTSPYMRGEHITWLQNRLLRHHALTGSVDGIFGPKTQEGVLLFQAARVVEGRDIGASKPDGKIGRKTAAILAE